jgi:2-methylisocitrate lyase-like PEP mutase family enzyme
MNLQFGRRLRQEIENRDLLAFIGVYDVFSATLAAAHFDSLFLSGFGFAASHYGLPDIGFIAWSDLVAFVQRVRTVLPHHHLLVDIDDGYGDPEVACHAVSLLEAAGASGVVLEDQRRPRRCGHFDGKQLLDLDEYVAKLHRVLQARRELVVVARTDASEVEEITRRVEAFAEAGADAVLVDGLRDLELIGELKQRTGLPFTFNQIAGGKSPACSLPQLSAVGVSLVIYSTPCLFAAQAAIEGAMRSLKEDAGRLRTGNGYVDVKECTAVLNENLARRGGTYRAYLRCRVPQSPRDAA